MPLSNLFQAKFSLFHSSFHRTRLAVILKFRYLCRVSEWSKPQPISNRSSFQFLFLDIGSESLQFNNANIYVQFGVTFIMFFGIFSFIFVPHMREFPWLGNEEIYIIIFIIKEAWTSYFRMSTHKVGEHFEKCVLTKIPLIFYWFLLFFIYAIF